jgi:squalene-associated FAD-dependent desaturase
VTDPTGTGNQGAMVHVVGAGLAGLSAAVRLAVQGHPVTLYEAAGQAGGRCRSYDDPVLGCRIDNGNHLLLSGNRSATAYLDQLGASDELYVAPEAAFPFLDLQTGARWTVRPNEGRIPWWVFAQSRRIPGTTAFSYASALRLLFARGERTVAEVLPQGALFDRFWEPLVIAALNAIPAQASARLLWHALKESFAKGGRHCRPMIARNGLSEAFVEPALAYLRGRGVPVHFNRRLRTISMVDGAITALGFGDSDQYLAKGDQVVLAVPPGQLRRFFPDLPLPADNSVILNAHFRLSAPAAPAGEPRFLGLLGGKAHWLFIRHGIASITISAADQLGLADLPEDDLLPELWREVRQALALPDQPYRAARLIRERRATFDQSPAGVALRPKADTGPTNLTLAGDFTDTGLPATIEGAIRSGETAATAVSRKCALPR